MVQDLNLIDKHGHQIGDKILTKCAETLRQKIEEQHFHNGYKITISLGISQFKYGDNEQSMFKRADDSLLKAKVKGRNRIG